MTEIIDIHTQQEHRAALRVAHKKNPDNETVLKALQKSLRPKYIRQAAKNGVFICYAMTDGVFALNLALALRDVGIRAFMDELDADESVEWGDTVNQALRDCAVLVMVLSHEGVKDAEVHGEYRYFMRRGKIIIPVIADACHVHGLDTLIEPIDFADDYDSAFAELTSLLQDNQHGTK